MRADFERLREAAKKERWTDKTPVAPEFFGPLWPEGQPPNWPHVVGTKSVRRSRKAQRAKVDTARKDKLVLRAIVHESVDDETLVAGILELYRALNRYDILCGGSGLTIDDWQVRAPAGERTGVLV